MALRRTLRTGTIAAVLAAAVGLCTATPAAARSGASPAAMRSAPSDLAAITQNDFELDGTVLATWRADSPPAPLRLGPSDAGGLEVDMGLSRTTVVEVGPYAVDPSYLVAGARARVWFHLDASGSPVADLVVVQPTVVKGTLLGVTAGKGGALLLTVAADGGQGTLRVAVLAATRVQVLPPWEASQGLGAVSRVAVVGVPAPDGTLLAAFVVGLVPSA
ncbi:MAG: hypothetical protein K6V73_03085 [Firmicutes bacterium]|nr:hypothetical protein [Bacillota bacterium]